MIPALKRHASAVFAVRFVCAAAVLALTATACGASAPADYGAQVLSPGEGPTNALPLEVLRPGMRAAGGIWVENALKVADHTGLRFHQGANYKEIWIENRPDGLYVLGGAQDGVVPHPQLHVPATVRLGMTWKTQPFGNAGVTYTYTVTDRKENVETALGTGTTWTIEQAGDKTPTVRTYLEGRGPVDRTSLILPLEDRPAEPEPEVSRMSLSPLTLADGKPATFTNFRGKRLDVVVWPAQQGFTFVMRGERAFWDADGISVGHMEVLPSADCFGWVAGRMADPGKTEGNGHLRAGTGCPKWVNPADPPGALPTLGQAHLAVVGTSKVFWADQGLGARSSSGYMGLLTGAYRGTALAQYQDDLDHTVGGAGLSGFLGSTERVIFGANADDGSTGLLILDDETGRVSTSAYRGDHIDLPHRAIGISGHTTVVRTSDSTDLLVATADGAVDRLEVVAGKLKRTRMAAFVLPEGEHLVGAALVDIGWLVLTGTQADPNPNHLNLGTVTAHIASRSQGAIPVPVTSALQTSLTWVGPDARVCWAETTAPLDKTGWLVGGKPAAAVLPDQFSSCALIVRDIDAFAERLGLPEWIDHPDRPKDFATVEGPIPGVGRTFMAEPDKTVELTAPGAAGPIAPLTGGGVVTTAGLLGPGGVNNGTSRYTPTGDSGKVDPSGYGIWQAPSDKDGDWAILLGKNPLKIRLGDPTGMPTNLVAVRQGGGVLIEQVSSKPYHVTATHLVRADGTFEIISNMEKNRAVVFVRENDERCGADAEGFYCYDKVGTLRSAPQPDQGGFRCYTPMGTQYMLVGTDTPIKQFYTVNLDTFALQPWKLPALEIKTVAEPLSTGDGLFAMVQTSDDVLRPYKLTPTGGVPIDDLPWSRVVGKKAYPQMEGPIWPVVSDGALWIAPTPPIKRCPNYSQCVYTYYRYFP